MKPNRSKSVTHVKSPPPIPRDFEYSAQLADLILMPDRFEPELMQKALRKRLTLFENNAH